MVFAFVKALFFRLASIRVVVSIHGLVKRDLVSLCCTCLSSRQIMLSLNDVHMLLVEVNVVQLNSVA